jgi:hypothetical protein
MRLADAKPNLAAAAAGSPGGGLFFNQKLHRGADGLRPKR